MIHIQENSNAETYADSLANEAIIDDISGTTIIIIAILTIATIFIFNSLFSNELYGWINANKVQPYNPITDTLHDYYIESWVLPDEIPIDVSLKIDNHEPLEPGDIDTIPATYHSNNFSDFCAYTYCRGDFTFSYWDFKNSEALSDLAILLVKFAKPLISIIIILFSILTPWSILRTNKTKYVSQHRYSYLRNLFVRLLLVSFFLALFQGLILGFIKQNFHELLNPRWVESIHREWYWHGNYLSDASIVTIIWVLIAYVTVVISIVQCTKYNSTRESSQNELITIKNELCDSLYLIVGIIIFSFILIMFFGGTVKDKNGYYQYGDNVITRYWEDEFNWQPITWIDAETGDLRSINSRVKYPVFNYKRRIGLFFASFLFSWIIVIIIRRFRHIYKKL